MKDITGERFGKLVVIAPHHKDGRGEWYWDCLCDCGNHKIVSGNKLRSGNTQSCGCYRKECKPHMTHGMTNTRLYSIWCNMKARCNNPKSIEYYLYGGRGITVCKQWQTSFQAFADWAFANGYTDQLTIDRIDVDGNYTPKNCRWLTPAEQALNQRRNHLVTAFGKTMTIKEWSNYSGIKYDTIERRLNGYGWSAEDAVSKKPR